MKRLSPNGQANLIRFVGNLLSHLVYKNSISLKTKSYKNSFIALAYGLLSIALAFGVQKMGSILAATITALGALSGPLGMVFVMGVLMPFVNKYVCMISKCNHQKSKLK